MDKEQNCIRWNRGCYMNSHRSVAFAAQNCYLVEYCFVRKDFHYVNFHRLHHSHRNLVVPETAVRAAEN